MCIYPTVLHQCLLVLCYFDRLGRILFVDRLWLWLFDIASCSFLGLFRTVFWLLSYIRYLGRQKISKLWACCCYYYQLILSWHTNKQKLQKSLRKIWMKWSGLTDFSFGFLQRFFVFSPSFASRLDDFLFGLFVCRHQSSIVGWNGISARQRDINCL